MIDQCKRCGEELELNICPFCQPGRLLVEKHERTFGRTSLRLPQNARARRADPETSHAAARSVRSLTDRQAAILQIISAQGPIHDHALVIAYAATDLPPQSESGIRTRRKELVHRGLVIDSGARAIMPSGRKAIIWMVCDESQHAFGHLSRISSCDK